MSGLGSKIIALHQALEAAQIPHAIGGAISLAYAIKEPRATVDIDINAFVSTEQVGEVLRALPSGIKVGFKDRSSLRRDGQVRLWWDKTPIDVFLSTVEFHQAAARRIEVVPFEKTTIPVLSATDLTVCKALYSRGKDWVDIEAMRDAGSIDKDEALRWVRQMLDKNHPSYKSLEKILFAAAASPGERDELPPALRPRTKPNAFAKRA